jgi:hypothetical protein
VCNYPTDEEGIKKLNDSQSQAMLRALKKKLPPEELDELMVRYAKRHGIEI